MQYLLLLLVIFRFRTLLFILIGLAMFGYFNPEAIDTATETSFATSIKTHIDTLIGQTE